MSAAAQPRYTAVAIALHWLIALGIIGMIGLGWYMGDLEDRAQQYALTQLHKSFGITILLLSVARLIWRLANPPPEEPPMPAWQAMTARVTHIAFYVLIIAMPLTGWIMVSASPTEIPTRLFQTIPWAHIPGLPNLSDEAKEAFAVPIEFTHSKARMGRHRPARHPRRRRAQAPVPRQGQPAGPHDPRRVRQD